MTLQNLEKGKIYVDVSLELNDLIKKPFTKIGMGNTQSKYVTATFGRHEVTMEDDKFYVNLYKAGNVKGEKAGNVKREIPIPATKATVSGEVVLAKDFTTRISHTISASSAIQEAAEQLGGTAAQMANATGISKSTPWITISYDADIYSDGEGKYFFYFFNKPELNIPLGLFDSSWY